MHTCMNIVMFYSLLVLEIAFKYHFMCKFFFFGYPYVEFSEKWIETKNSKFNRTNLLREPAMMFRILLIKKKKKKYTYGIGTLILPIKVTKARKSTILFKLSVKNRDHRESARFR